MKLLIAISTVQKMAILLCFAAALSPQWGQSQVAFEAFTDARQVLKDGSFELKFVLNNADASDFKPPAFEGFRVLSGPYFGVGTTIINGRVSKETTYIYNLRPLRTGAITIGSASIKADGRLMYSPPVTVEVLASAAKASEGQIIFFAAEPSTTKAWAGQQIALDYRLYTTVNYDSPTVLEESSYQGFYAEDIRRFDSRPIREVVNGVQYVAKTLKRIALFPQQAGTLTVSPMNIVVGVIKDDSGRQRSFFFSPEVERTPLSTQPVSIQVSPLPAGAPASFTGAVGHFTMTPFLSRTVVTTDDVLSLRLTINGEGDIKRIQAPTLDVPPAFELYEPTVIEEEAYEMNGEIRGKKTFEYLFLPKETGGYQLQPAFSYFNPDSARYVVLEGAVYDITVRPGSKGGSQPDIEPADTGGWKDISSLKMETQLYRQGKPLLGSPLFWGLLSCPLLLLGGAIAYKRRQLQQQNIDPLLLRTRAARKMAQAHLARAEVFLKAADSRAFYDEVSKAMLGYTSDKLHIPRSALAKDSLRQRLEELDTPAELSARFLEIIDICELALFAGKDNAPAMQDTYQKALQVIEQMEER